MPPRSLRSRTLIGANAVMLLVGAVAVAIPFVQIGGALGVAIVTTVAVSRSEHFLAANEGANQLAVLNEGFQSAFLAVVALATIGIALALPLRGRPRTARQPGQDPAPATSAGD